MHTMRVLNQLLAVESPSAMENGYLNAFAIINESAKHNLLDWNYMGYPGGQQAIGDTVFNRIMRCICDAGCICGGPKSTPIPRLLGEHALSIVEIATRAMKDGCIDVNVDASHTLSYLLCGSDKRFGDLVQEAMRRAGDPNPVDRDGETPIQVFVRFGCKARVAHAIFCMHEWGADLEFGLDMYGHTLLQALCQRYNYDALFALAEKDFPGCDPWKENEKGRNTFDHINYNFMNCESPENKQIRGLLLAWRSRFYDRCRKELMQTPLASVSMVQTVDGETVTTHNLVLITAQYLDGTGRPFNGLTQEEKEEQEFEAFMAPELPPQNWQQEIDGLLQVTENAVPVDNEEDEMPELAQIESDAE